MMSIACITTCFSFAWPFMSSYSCPVRQWLPAVAAWDARLAWAWLWWMCASSRLSLELFRVHFAIEVPTAVTLSQHFTVALQFTLIQAKIRMQCAICVGLLSLS